MKVKNPKHKDKVKELAGLKAKVFADYMAAHATEADITFEQIRADFADIADPKTGGPLTDGTIDGIFQALGYQVTE